MFGRISQLYHKEQMVEDLRPIGQFGVSVPNGCEIVYHAIRSALQLHNDWTVLGIDVANTYNDVNSIDMFNA